MTGNSKEHVLNEEEFNRALNACDMTDSPLEDKFLVLVMGRLGLRHGETAHIKNYWVDFIRGEITIPSHDPCDCNYCWDALKGKLKRQDIQKNDVKKIQWCPKTEAGARTIYFEFDPELKEVIKRIFTKYEACPFTCRNIRERIREIGKRSGLSKLHPHGLRATAATNFAYDGMDAMTLKSVMGWENINIAVKYLATSGALARRSMEKIYGHQNKYSLFDSQPRKYYITEFGNQLARRKLCDNDEERIRYLINCIQNKETR